MDSSTVNGLLSAVAIREASDMQGRGLMHSKRLHLLCAEQFHARLIVAEAMHASFSTSADLRCKHVVIARQQTCS